MEKQSSSQYLRQFTDSRIYPVTCLVQTYREYALFVTTVCTDQAEQQLTEESLVNLVKAELSKLVPSQLLYCKLVRDQLLVRSREDQVTATNVQVPAVDRYKLRILPRNLMTLFADSYDVSVYILPRGRFSLIDTDFPLSFAREDGGELSVTIKSADHQQLAKTADKSPLMTSVLFKEMFEHTKTNPRDRRYTPVTHFDCKICLETKMEISKGYKLQRCSHLFCKECLKGHIHNADNVLEIICPHVEKSFFRDDKPCDQKFNDIEIMYLLKDDFKSFSQYMVKRQNQNELAQAKSRIHCATPDCTGYFQTPDDEQKLQKCSKCHRFNCFVCTKAFDAAEHSCEPLSKQDNSMESLVQSGDVVRCPKCHIYLEKQSAGCQLIRCYFCRMDICWLTKLPRWGPNGKGDISAGCRCGVGGKKCHPDCNNCH